MISLEEIEGKAVALLDTPLDKLVDKPVGEHFEEAHRSPWLASAERDLEDSAGAQHADRSRESRTADESFNAPIAESYRQWVEAPNRYDLPGIDTIPEERLLERAERLLALGVESGAVEELKVGRGSGRSEKNPGTFRAKRDRGGFEDWKTDLLLRDPDKLKKEARVPSMGMGFIAAHEAGHALDFDATGKATERYGSDYIIGIKGDREEATRLIYEGADLSTRMRGGFDEDDEYRWDPHEIAADVIASSVLEPRAARREAPEVTERIRREIIEPARKKAAESTGKRPLEVDLRGEGDG